MPISHIGQLTPDPKNARKHGPRNLGTIERALNEVGAARSIVIDEAGVILAGNATVEAAALAGIEKVHVVEADGETIIAVRRTVLTPEQKTKLALYDNRAAELAEGWDADILQELADEGLDLSGLWREDELTALLAQVDAPQDGLLPGTDPDAIPEQVETRCKPGDLWQLGRHRLLCGDSTNPQHVERVMEGKQAHLCLTDPPYGVNLDYHSTNDTEENLHLLIADFLPLARSVAPVVLLTPGNKNQMFYPRPEWTLGWFVPAGAARGPWGFTCWQPVLAYGKDPYLQARKGSRPDALCLTESSEGNGHPCPKPVKVWQWFMERGSLNTGDIIYDPFLGSGTTLIAAEQLGRTCYGLEIEPKYCDIILQRWEDATGQTAARIE